MKHKNVNDVNDVNDVCDYCQESMAHCICIDSWKTFDRVTIPKLIEKYSDRQLNVSNFGIGFKILSQETMDHFKLNKKKLGNLVDLKLLKQVLQTGQTFLEITEIKYNSEAKKDNKTKKKGERLLNNSAMINYKVDYNKNHLVSFKLFSNGSVIITMGSNCLMHCVREMWKIFKAFRQISYTFPEVFNYHPLKLHDLKTTLINSSICMGFNLRLRLLEKLITNSNTTNTNANNHFALTSYDPNRYQGVKTKIVKDTTLPSTLKSNRTSVSAFSTGKILINSSTIDTYTFGVEYFVDFVSDHDHKAEIVSKNQTN